ncbi:MAG: TonB C-terminal domain-containing protein [Acidobacteriota bacterium]|jgi:hypothetical protein
MFDFAIEHNQRRRPAKRLVVSIVASCLLHILLVIVLIENPWLLQGGFYTHFRGLIIMPDDSNSQFEFDDEDYRTVAVLRPMELPSAEVLKGLIHDWDKPRETESGEDDSIQIRWGSDEENAVDEDIRISTETTTEPEPAPAGDLDASDLASESIEPAPETGEGSDAETGEFVVTEPEPGSETEAAPAETEAAVEEETLAMDIAPSIIPDSIPKLPQKSSEDSNRGEDNIKTFENEAQAISKPGIGIFDDHGFPLDDYANRIKQLVTGNWYIPSSLRDPNAYTTIVFYIDRNGQNFDTRIVESSGNNSLNLTALNAIINSNPFPPLPQNFPGDHIGVKYVFIPEIR